MRLEDRKFTVQAKTKAAKEHVIHIDFINNILECDCETNVELEIFCRHILLFFKINKSIEYSKFIDNLDKRWLIEIPAIKKDNIKIFTDILIEFINKLSIRDRYLFEYYFKSFIDQQCTIFKINLNNNIIKTYLTLLKQKYP